MPTTIFLCQQALGVGVSDYPANFPINLDGAAQGSAQNIQGKIVSQTPIKLGKDAHPGQEVLLEFAAGKYRARNYAVGSRLYHVMVVGRESVTKSDRAERFLDLFTLVN